MDPTLPLLIAALLAGGAILLALHIKEGFVALCLGLLLQGWFLPQPAGILLVLGAIATAVFGWRRWSRPSI